MKNLVKGVLRKAAHAAIDMTTPLDTNIAEITPYTFRRTEFGEKRINLLVPSINPEHVFGGISTALKFFEELCEKTGFARRIILVDAAPSEEAKGNFSGRYTFADCGEDCGERMQIVPYSDRAGKSIPVSANDYFMFTGWWTAHCCQEAYEEFEQKEGMAPNIFLNFIQDFEPGFYPWSSRYLLAEATYKNHYPQIAMFNTGLLHDYFKKNGFSFDYEFAFEPVLNATLKKHYDEIGAEVKKKKQILLYGRPGTERNAFTLLVAILKKWVWMQEDVQDWKILSAGEQHEPVELGNGKRIESVGKLTLDGYAQVLEESYAGISLMASPHPSYPPLEMSVFDVKVMTNTFGNKDLKDFNENIVSMDNISPISMAKRLQEICSGYTETVEHKKSNPQYLENRNLFSFIDELKKLL